MRRRFVPRFRIPTDGVALTAGFIGLCLAQLLINSLTRQAVVPHPGFPTPPGTGHLAVWLVAGLLLRVRLIWALGLVCQTFTITAAVVSLTGLGTGVAGQTGVAVIWPPAGVGYLIATGVCTLLSFAVLLTPGLRYRQRGVGFFVGCLRTWVFG